MGILAMSFLLIYTAKDGSTVHRTVTRKNLWAIAGEMARKGKNMARKAVLAAKLENELKKFDGG